MLRHNGDFKSAPGKSSTSSAYDIIYELRSSDYRRRVINARHNWKPINITSDISMASPYSAQY
jgi:hypothetical protein